MIVAAAACVGCTDGQHRATKHAVEPSEDTIAIHLQAKPGATLDASEIGRCLDYTVERASR